MTDIGLLLLRVGFAGMLLTHGWGKLTGFNEMAAMFPDPIGVGPIPSLILTVFAEFFCSLAVLLGFMTRYTTLPPLITMLVAFFIVHAQDPMMKKELALVYAVAFAVMFLVGPGKFSLDQMKRRL